MNRSYLTIAVIYRRTATHNTLARSTPHGGAKNTQRTRNPP